MLHIPSPSISLSKNSQHYKWTQQNYPHLIKVDSLCTFVSEERWKTADLKHSSEKQETGSETWPEWSASDILKAIGQNYVADLYENALGINPEEQKGGDPDSLKTLYNFKSKNPCKMGSMPI